MVDSLDRQLFIDCNERILIELVFDCLLDDSTQYTFVLFKLFSSLNTKSNKRKSLNKTSTNDLIDMDKCVEEFGAQFSNLKQHCGSFGNIIKTRHKSCARAGESSRCVRIVPFVCSGISSRRDLRSQLTKNQAPDSLPLLLQLHTVS